MWFLRVSLNFFMTMKNICIFELLCPIFFFFLNSVYIAKQLSMPFDISTCFSPHSTKAAINNGI